MWDTSHRVKQILPPKLLTNYIYPIERRSKYPQGQLKGHTARAQAVRKWELRHIHSIATVSELESGEILLEGNIFLLITSLHQKLSKRLGKKKKKSLKPGIQPLILVLGQVC